MTALFRRWAHRDGDTPRYTIVIVWTDMDGLRDTGRVERFDGYNYRPVLERCLRARSVIWLNRGTISDVAKAQTYAAQCGEDRASVYTYPTTENDPRGKAEAAVLALAAEGGAA